MALHPKDTKASNPRIQCSVCGKWKRLYVAEEQPPFGLRMTIFGGCHHSGGDHLAGDKRDVCAECCDISCAALAKAQTQA